MFWACPRLSGYWSAIVEFINGRLQLDIPLMAELALLGIQEDEQRPRYTKLLLLYAKKGILLKWTSRSPPTVGAWVDLVNAILPIGRLTNVSRGCNISRCGGLGLILPNPLFIAVAFYFGCWSPPLPSSPPPTCGPGNMY